MLLPSVAVAVAVAAAAVAASLPHVAGMPLTPAMVSHLVAAARVPPPPPVWAACRVPPDAATPADVAAIAAAVSQPDAYAAATSALACRFNTSVSGTALTQLLANGTWPGVTDPFMDDVALTVLPDISVTGPAFYTFIYATHFATPPAGASAPYTVLALPQVNYRVHAYVNGVLVPPLAPPSTGNLSGGAAGMYRRWWWNLTAAVAQPPGTQNVLALAVAPPDHPGNASNTCNVCGQGGNHQLAQDVTSQDAAGWDWIGGTPDRNTGVAVAAPAGGIAAAAPVLLRDGAVFTLAVDRAAGATSGNATVTVVVAGTALDGSSGGVAGTLCVSLALDAAATRTVAACGNGSLAGGGGVWSDVTVGPLTLPDVPLWWPHTLGPATLINVTATFTCAASGAACAAPLAWRAGIRTATSTVDAGLGGRVFAVNGERVFLTGGNFIGADQLARFADVPARWAAEVALHAAAGLNFMRLWGGSGGAPGALYDAADAAGVLLQVEGWMTGDNNGRWAGSYEWPLDHALFNAAVADTVSALRGHAAVLLWCGGNELYPAGASPPPDILAGWHASLAALDYGSRTFVPSSASNVTDYDAAYALAPSDGPYGILDEREFFYRNPGQYYANGSRALNLSMPFQPEIGSVSSPEAASMARFLSPAQLAALPPRGAGGANVSAVWQFHRYIPFTDAAGCDHVYAYGAPANASEYALRAALAQVRQYQSLFEGYGEYAWQFYSAVVMWKTQAPWPAFRGALYDWYLAATGGLWGARVANTPLHIQLNLATAAVAVVNKGLAPTPPLTATAQFYHLTTGAAAYPAPGIVTPLPPVAGGGVARTPPLAWPAALPPNATALVRLTLASAADGSVLDVTDYWLSTLSANATAVPCATYDDLAAVRDAGPGAPSWAAVAVAATAAPCDGVPPGTCAVVTAVVSNPAPGAPPAFSVRLAVHADAPLAARQPFAVPDDAPAAAADSRVLPAFASANYFTLLAGEQRTVTITAPLYTGSLAALTLAVDGWNVAPAVIVPTLARAHHNN